MNSPIPDASPGLDARGLLKSFQEKYPVFQEFKPLSIGIDRQLMAQETGLPRRILRLALGMHTHSFRYLKVMEKADRRFNLDGSPGDEVTEEHRQYAAEILRERSRKETERRKTERKEKEVQAAERRRVEKLDQLMKKFAK